MPGLPSGLAELVEQLNDEHGEDAVRRALSLVPVVSLVRDESEHHLSTATSASRHDGISGALVLGVSRKANQPTEITWHGGDVAVMAVPKSMFK